jgi:hypothetical protein
MTSIKNESLYVSPPAKATSVAASHIAIVSSEHRNERPFELREASIGGNGPCKDAAGHSWDTLLAQIYDGRGG